MQRYLDQLTSAGVVEREKVGRAFKYCLSDPSGELSTCPDLPSPDDIMAGQVGTCASCPPSDAEDDDWGRTVHEAHESSANVGTVAPIIFNSMDPDDLDKDDWAPETAVISKPLGTDPATSQAPNDRADQPSTGYAQLRDHELAAESGSPNVATDSTSPYDERDGSATTANTGEA